MAEEHTSSVNSPDPKVSDKITVVTPEERMDAALKQAFDDISPTHKAKFKIEVTFGPNRTTTGPNLCSIMVWESGRKMDGEADVPIHQCKMANRPTFKSKKHNFGDPKADSVPDVGCGKFIPSDCTKPYMIRSDKAKPTTKVMGVCPHCQREWPDMAYTTDIRMGRWRTKVLAEIVAGIWRDLDCDADIYVKYHEADIRVASLAARGALIGGAQDILDKARELKGLTIYPKCNIIKDTMAGSSLESRIYTLFVQ